MNFSIRHLLILALLARTAVAADLSELEVILTVKPDDEQLVQLTMVALNHEDIQKRLKQLSMVSARFELLQPKHLGSVGPGDSSVDAQWALVYETVGIGKLEARTVKIALSPDEVLDILRAQEFYMSRDTYGIRRHSGGYAYASPTNTIELAIDEDGIVKKSGHVVIDVGYTFTDAKRLTGPDGRMNSVAAIDVSEGLQYTTMSKSPAVPFWAPPGIGNVDDSELTAQRAETVRFDVHKLALDSPFAPDDRQTTVRGDLPSVEQALERAKQGDNSYMRFAADFGPQRQDDELTESQKITDRSLKYNQLMPIMPVAMTEGQKKLVVFLPIDQLKAYQEGKLNQGDLLVIPPEAVRFVPGDKQWNMIVDDYLDLRKYKNFEEVFVAKVHDENGASEREMSVREMIGESDEVMENIGPKQIEESIMELHRDAPPGAKKMDVRRPRKITDHDEAVQRLLRIANEGDERRRQGEQPVLGQDEDSSEGREPDLMRELEVLRSKVAAQEDEIASLKEQRSDTQVRRARVMPIIGSFCMKGLRLLGRMVGIGR